MSKKKSPPKTPPPAKTYNLPEMVAPWARKSYVLSRFWAWCSRIELKPRVRIPVPRAFSYRDP